MADLVRVLNPESIAVIGGGDWGAAVITQCQKIGFAGQLWVIHPTHDQVAGIPAYRRLQDLPGVPDVAFIAVNRHATVDAVATLSAMGSHGAICFASGFREASQEDAEGNDLQDTLLAAAGDMRIIGPNCYGFINYVDRCALWPDHHGGQAVDRGVALITQSSNIALNLTMQKRGLPIAFIVTVGNQAQTGLSEIGMTLLRNPAVTALGLHIEGIDDLRQFEALALEARKCGKRIVVLKVGKSAEARTTTVSHTASLAGTEAGAQALLDRLGMGMVTSLSAMLETLKLLHVVGPLASARIGSMSCSGGEASLMADAAQGTAVIYPALNARQETDLRAALGPRVALSNPLDYHTYIWGDEGAMARTFAAMMDPSLSLGVVVLDFPRADRCQAPAWDLVINAVGRAQTETGLPIAILSSLPETMPEDVATALVAQGILPFCGMVEAMEAISVAAHLGTPFAVPEPLFIADPMAPGKTMTEAEAKAALVASGVTVPRSHRAQSASDAAAVASKLGFPVVLKAEGVAHKTDIGGVALDLPDGAAVMAAAGAMPASGFLVEEMVTGVVCELLIGVVHDPAHGFVLTLAAGGTLTEVMSDSVSLLVPSSDASIDAALSRLRIAPLIDGYRGATPANRRAIVEAVLAVQSYVCAHAPYEVEINPLLCTPDRAIAADALIITGASHD